jgi:hypothetical protein
MKTKQQNNIIDIQRYLFELENILYRSYMDFDDLNQLYVYFIEGEVLKISDLKKINTTIVKYMSSRDDKYKLIIQEELEQLMKKYF